MNKIQRVYQTLETCLQELSGEDLSACVQDGTLAADLHAYYNHEGLEDFKKRGSNSWFKPEYATPLSKQDSTNQRKNVDAAGDVVKYWLSQFIIAGTEIPNNSAVMDDMFLAVAYEENRGNSRLEAASDSQHEQWRQFVDNYQKERITPGNPKFREANYKQFITSYVELCEREKDQDRLVIAVVTDRILERADIGHKRHIQL